MARFPIMIYSGLGKSGFNILFKETFLLFKLKESFRERCNNNKNNNNNNNDT